MSPLGDAVERWRRAVISNVPSQQIQPYATHLDRYFLATDWTRDQVLDYLAKQHIDGEFSSLQIRDIVIDSEGPNSASVHFEKDFSYKRKGETTSAVVRSVLHFVREAGDWKISYERDFKS